MQAPKGGTKGLNGEFYKGGQFLPTNEKTIKGQYSKTVIPNDTPYTTKARNGINLLDCLVLAKYRQQWDVIEKIASDNNVDMKEIEFFLNDENNDFIQSLCIARMHHLLHGHKPLSEKQAFYYFKALA